MLMTLLHEAAPFIRFRTRPASLIIGMDELAVIGQNNWNTVKVGHVVRIVIS